MKKFKLKIKHDFAEALEKIIDDYMTYNYADFDDKLVIAGLVEIKDRLYKKLGNYQTEYQISLTPVQAIALRLFITDFSEIGVKSYMGNRLFQISNAIHQQFQ